MASFYREYPMKIGFTGTQQGMTPLQLATFKNLIAGKYGEFHHGDCYGADAEAHDAVDHGGLFTIVVHPPTNEKKRAFKKSPCILRPFPYLMRNQHIVDATEWLIATPKEFDEQMRSGTWSTVRYAVKRGHDVTIILPDGVLRCR